MFRHLRTKLTLLFAGLFALALTLVSLAVYTAIDASVRQTVRREMVAGGAVFDRLWALRSQHLEDAASLLAGDFGFRSAVATGDQATIQSALENLRSRLDIDVAITIDIHGRMVSTDDAGARGSLDAIRAAVEADEQASGILTLNGAPYQAMAAPVLAPTTIGWLVFAVKLDDAQMKAVEQLSAIPLEARALTRRPDGLWATSEDAGAGPDDRAVSRVIDSAMTAKTVEPRELDTSAGEAIALAKPFKMMTAGEPVVLLLRYPLARALAPYQPLFALIVVVGLFGIVLVAAGSWVLARGVTRPISALEHAVHALENGESAAVPVLTQDEIGRLSESFNGMAGRIRAREGELTTTRAFLDAVIGSLPVMVVVKDVDGRFALVNRAGEELLGMSSDEMLGKTDHDFFPADQADFFVERDKAVLESGKLEVIAEEPLTTVSGEVRYLQTKKIAIRDAEGRPQYLVAISEDITERKRAAEALETARDQAEAANRAKSSFLANMSHEVRTPLNGVLGVASVLSGTRLDPGQKEMVGIIENSATVLQRVLSDVLDLARVEAGRLDIVAEAFDLEAALRTLAGAASVQCQAKGLGFRLELDGAMGAMVCADRVRLEQVVGNLLSNAVKFTEKGEVSLTAAREGDSFRFTVRDTGIGFDPALNDLLFEPFRQEDSSITRRFGGTGLGLAISRELARAMGGDLTAEGEPGVGAAFTAILPLPPAEESEVLAGTRNEPAPAEGEAAGSDPMDGDEEGGEAEAAERGLIRVLLADDHATNRMVVELILKSVGVELVAVENGAEAVEAFKRERFDVVLMDLQMPVMDGLSAIKLIRQTERLEQAPPTPILVVSANAMVEHVETALAAGADGHLAKPITASALLAALETALEGGALAAGRHAA